MVVYTPRSGVRSMKWNLEELHQNIKELENRINLVNNQEEREILISDLNNLKEMVNYSAGTKIYEEDNSSFKILKENEEYIEDSIDFINENRKKLRKILDKVSYFRCIPRKLNISNRIKLPEYDELLKEFLQNFDERIFNLYENYKLNEQIEFNKGRYENNYTCLGRCYHINSESKSYISVRYGNYIKKPSILPHELAHAYQMKVDSGNVINAQRKILSLLSEAYAIFIEFAFLDYLKETKYKFLAFSNEGLKLDNYLTLIEYSSNNLTGEYDKFKYFKEQKLNTLMLSNLVALYWLDLYRTNQSDALKKINEFNNNYGISLVSDYFKEVSLDNLHNSCFNEINYYLSNYRKRVK